MALRTIIKQLILSVSCDGDYEEYVRNNERKVRLYQDAITYINNLFNAIFEEVDQLYKNSYIAFAEDSLNSSSNKYGYIIYHLLVCRNKCNQFEDHYDSRVDLSALDIKFPYETTLFRSEKIEILMSLLKLIILINYTHTSKLTLTNIDLSKTINIINIMNYSKEVHNLPVSRIHK